MSQISKDSKQTSISFMIEKRFKEVLPVDVVVFAPTEWTKWKQAFPEIEEKECILVIPHTIPTEVVEEVLGYPSSSLEREMPLNYVLWVLAIWVDYIVENGEREIPIHVEKHWNFTKSNRTRLSEMYTAFVSNTYAKSYMNIHDWMYNVLLLLCKEYDKQESNKTTDVDFPQEWYAFKQGAVLTTFLIPLFDQVKEANKSVKAGTPVDRFNALRQCIVDGKTNGTFTTITPFFQVVSTTPSDVKPEPDRLPRRESHSNSSYYVIPSHSGDTPDCSYDRHSLDRSCSIQSIE